MALLYLIGFSHIRRKPIGNNAFLNLKFPTTGLAGNLNLRRTRSKEHFSKRGGEGGTELQFTG